MATQPGHAPNGASGTAPSAQHSEGFWQRRRLSGAIAGVLWLLVFSGGILIDSEDSRVALGWKRQDTSGQAEVGRVAQQLVDDPAENAAATAALKKVVRRSESAAAEAKARQKKVEGRWPIHNFLCGMLFFTPINVALLAILAGFIGGCLSSRADLRWIEDDMREANQGQDRARLMLLRRRWHYLTEHPFHSTIRSFIIYLIFISGLYVFSSDPFNANSQSQGFTQYMRLAGIVSLLGFVVGYDPTKFQEWLALVPSPSRSLKRNDDGQDGKTSVRVVEEKKVVTDTHEETRVVAAAEKTPAPREGTLATPAEQPKDANVLKKSPANGRR